MPRVGLPESSASASVLVFAAVILLLIFAKVLLVPLAFALTLSFLLLPLVDFLEKRGCRRAFAVGIAAALATVTLFSGTYVVSRQVVNVASTLPGYRANIEKRLASLHSPSAASLANALAMLEDLSGDLDPNRVGAEGHAIPVTVVGQRSDKFQATMKLLGVIFEPIGQIGIVIVFAMYMLTNREEFRHRLLLLAGIGNLNLVTRALADATERISKYLLLQVEVNACYGLLFGTGLYFLHVPEATLWGVIAGTLRIVPFVGTLMGMVVPLVLSIAISDSWWPPILVIALFVVLEGTTGNFIEPLLFRSKTGISELALLSSAILWFTLWGWPGLVLSTPLTACFVVLGRYVPQLSFLHSLLGSNAALSPAAHLYERLLAMDQDEARNITEKFLKKHSLLELYDTVVLPVLGLAEEDRYKGALTNVQSKFVLLCLGDLIARLAEHPSEPIEEPRSERSVLIEAHAPARKQFAVICIATGEKMDELASVMLTQLVERAGHATAILPAAALSDEVLAGLANENDTVIFLSALPPFAFARTRALCLQVRSNLPGNRIAVALWNSGEDADEVTTRFGSAHPTVTITNLGHAIREVNRWQRETRH
ncbi:putative PurR-regulated permease PerM [Granulicella aggregans]|uniref:Putative PurR-regulated permease PerM n=1 Tax=Granulicella aggregans TaxID=474949 RepID=A0A7W7ZKB0_9BACT|nr:AI-2E family transporter [Granulicella aggregans]MBB5061347.1 putative PurR-regulated permease PerM [Granulicella aggregans]